MPPLGRPLPVFLPNDYEAMFDLAPVSLWLEDYSGVKALFERWRADGITDLVAHLRADRSRIDACMQAIRLVRVNRRTLELYGARDQDHLVANLPRVFRDDMADGHIGELAQLWEGGGRFSSETVNYALSGERLDLLLDGTVLPGHEERWDRVLVAIEDVTARARAERNLARSEAYARGLFEDSPVSLWVEDFSAIRRRLSDLRARGITDLRTFLSVHPDFVSQCMREIRVMDVNRRTLTMFGAPSREALLTRLDEVFRDDMRTHFAEQLIDLWDGRLVQQREVVNYTLGGERVNVYMQFTVMPGHEADWELVLVSLTDITARKKAEAYLEYLGKHDVLTQLANRSFFESELARLERTGPHPVAVVMADLNGLKVVNDQDGHAAGDALLRRAGEVLAKAVTDTMVAARLGGDEFALLVPGGDEAEAVALVERIASLVDLNNQYYQGARLEFALGAAVWHEGERIETTLSRADERMYEAKKRWYSSRGRDRRR
ncbi:MAG: diguanylate cyclase [Burkholderiales bacterium]|nr:diguanylate cyclase [Burkholderiales bacterium]MCE7875858.1 diguanylate cyclase [Betaproteobacteria bacterium PRO3]